MDQSANDMYYSAMIKPAETPHLPVTRLLTGRFQQTSGYRAQREHGVGDWLLVHTLGGAGRFGFPGGELIVAPGDWVLLRPGTPHDYGVEAQLQQWDLIWAHFQPRADWHKLLTWPAAAPGLLHLRLGPIAGPDPVALFFDVHRHLTGAQRNREDFAMNALETLLLACDQHNQAAAPDVLDPRVRLAMDYFVNHLADKVRLEDVAANIGISPSRLAHLFREQTGQTPQVYLEARRMAAASEMLLRTGFAIQQIAASVGFESPFYFSRRFSRWTGQSPETFRRNAAR